MLGEVRHLLVWLGILVGRRCTGGIYWDPGSIQNQRVRPAGVYRDQRAMFPFACHTGARDGGADGRAGADMRGAAQALCKQTMCMTGPHSCSRHVALVCYALTCLRRQVASAIGKAAMPAGNTQSGDQPQGNMLQQSNHPTALMFHVGFKLAALIVYMFGALFSKSFVVSFVMVVLLLAFDFWTVKNVSGRLLVGLRWWNEVREDGTNEWRFESREDTSRISDLDSRVFWLTLWVMPLIWGIFTVSTFFSFNYGWMLCCLVRVRRSSCAASFPRCSLPRILLLRVVVQAFGSQRLQKADSGSKGQRACGAALTLA